MRYPPRSLRRRTTLPPDPHQPPAGARIRIGWNTLTACCQAHKADTHHGLFTPGCDVCTRYNAAVTHAAHELEASP